MKIIVEYISGKVLTYSIVPKKRGKNEILKEHVKELINGPRVKSYKFVEPQRTQGDGSGESKAFVNRNEHENIPMPMAIADEIVFHAKGTGKGFTKALIDRWNEHLDFDLHTKIKRYGFSGSSRLNTIFEI